MQNCLNGAASELNVWIVCTQSVGSTIDLKAGVLWQAPRQLASDWAKMSCSEAESFMPGQSLFPPGPHIARPQS